MTCRNFCQLASCEWAICKNNNGYFVSFLNCSKHDLAQIYLCAMYVSSKCLNIYKIVSLNVCEYINVYEHKFVCIPLHLLNCKLENSELVVSMKFRDLQIAQGLLSSFDL